MSETHRTEHHIPRVRTLHQSGGTLDQKAVSRVQYSPRIAVTEMEQATPIRGHLFIVFISLPTRARIALQCMSPTDVIFSKSKKGITLCKMTNHPETRTCSVTYHNKAMYQVSVEYVKGYGKKV